MQESLLLPESWMRFDFMALYFFCLWEDCQVVFKQQHSQISIPVQL